MSRYFDFLLIGGGPASVSTAETLIEEGAEGSVALIMAEPVLPYFRPSLSKQFLLGKQSREQLQIHSEQYYRQNRIELIQGTRATCVVAREHVVRTDRTEPLRYGKLLIATGARPNRPNVPGDTLENIFLLRTLADAESIKAKARPGMHAVIIGGNFIGMEAASTLTQKGLRVTLIVMGNALFDTLRSRVLSEFFLRYYQERGIEVIFDDHPREFQVDGGNRIVTTQGGRTITCDLVVLGIGVSPETEFLRDSGIETDDGVLVDQFLQTNQPDIFSAGDVARYFDPIFKEHCRVEHWDNAMKQGRVAAKNMLGQRQIHSDLSYFFSDVFDLNFEFIGDTKSIDETVERGSLEKRSFALLYLKENVPRALFSLGRPAVEVKSAESLIRNRVNLKEVKAHLSDPRFELQEIPAQTVFVLQGGGALGAFECGVIRALEEARIYPDVIAGVSIGAFNGVIAAGNPRNASAALESFWNDLAMDTIDLSDETSRQMLSSWQVLLFGSPRFFRPRWFMPSFNPADLPLFWTSFYDPTPVKELLRKYVDFSKLKYSPVRLLVNAVNVETAEIETFDSYVDDLTPEHILASGSLPPGFPWTEINGKYYWDGGIVSNSPLEQVIERCGGTGKRVFIIDLYSNRKVLPQNFSGVMARRDEIVYSERIRKDVRTRELVHDFRRLIEEILSAIDPASAHDLRQRPSYIQLMGDLAPLKITRIIHEGEEGELPQRDYEFSRKTIERHKIVGYTMARKALNQIQTELPDESKLHTVESISSSEM